MQDKLAAKIESLGFKLPKWNLPPTEDLVCEFEKRFGLTLPADFRGFLVRYGGVSANASCPFQEPTPCGNSAEIGRFYGFTLPNRHDNVIDETKKADGYPDVIAIGDNLMGEWFWLKCLGWDAGHVYMYDNQGRSAWPDEMFYKMFSNLHPEIKNYLAIRRNGKLPEKRAGYEHVYLLANNFSEFIDSLELVNE
jgi:hypothetical protein